MNLLLPAVLSLGASLAAADPGPEARQTAARVRASMLTQDWSWLREDSNLGETVCQGLADWARAAPSLDALVVRVRALTAAMQHHLFKRRQFDWIAGNLDRFASKHWKIPAWG
jgi:hypothetical protein